MLPVIFSFAGSELSDRERDFFRAAQPAGFILSQRNLADPAKVPSLTAELRDILGRDRPPILIDRPAEPSFAGAASPATLGGLFARDARAGVRAAHLNARLIAADLFEMGITVDTAPSLDVLVSASLPDAAERAYSADLAAVIALARGTLHGYRLEGISPCLRHIPGLGRARPEPQLAAPVVDAGVETLRDSDFSPFKEMADAPFAIAAHAIYRAFDSDRVAPVSVDTIRKAIRGHCGFQGVLLSSPLQGNLPPHVADHALTFVKAGCDAALYSSGRLPDMEAIAEALPSLSAESAARVKAAELWGALSPVAGDHKAFRVERDRLLALN